MLKLFIGFCLFFVMHVIDTKLFVFSRWCGSENVGMKKSYDNYVKFLRNVIKSRLKQELMVCLISVFPFLKMPLTQSF